ncbi:hypothetical protein K227x_53290 [Rubripirellula lacrimiformis]|uniref:Uncharacterized protein n=1 Tax=Rubripirellula lacrimiformis TaxID=1930273 RepID=A0A517NID9_9BACT|nr:hypothetical protein [Rubripirellula lacrimiformis]QDT06906.1 hypothetical protein K227x_53290 [Rubripirellula lacrimiformis]
MIVQLHDLRAERRERLNQNRRAREEAAMPKTPLQEMIRLVAEKQATKANVGVETLEQLDAVLTSTERMALDWPADASAIATGLLRSLLRLNLVKVTGKPNSAPEHSRVAMKLFQKNVIDKPTMRRITASLKTDNPVHILDTCRALLVLLAN